MSKRALAYALGLGALLTEEEAEASLARLGKRGLRLVEEGDQFNLIDDATGGYAGMMTVDELPNGNLWSLDTELLPQYRGQGIGNEYYDAVEELSGKKMQPSPWLSMDGVRFWGRRDPEALANMVRNDEFYDPDNFGKVEGWLKDNEYAEFSHPEDNTVKLRGFRENYAVPLAGALGLGALAQSEDADAMFMGTGAKNAPLDMLGMAEKMEYLGIPRLEIWQKTGWGRGADGKWRFEVDDSEWFAPVDSAIRLSPIRGDRKWQGSSKLKRDENNEIIDVEERKYGTAWDGSRIGWGVNPSDFRNIVGGDELINAYPALAEVEIGRSRIPDPSNWDHGGAGGGAFNGVGQSSSPISSGGHTGTLRWDPLAHQFRDSYGASDGYLARPPTLQMGVIYEPSLSDSADNLDKAIEQYRSTMAHETQHAIQALEAWAPGGSVNSSVKQAGYGSLFESKWIDEAIENAKDGPDQLIDLFAKDQAEMKRLRQERGDRWDDPDFDREANTAQIKRLRDDIAYMKERFPYAVEAARYRELIKDTKDGPYQTRSNSETYKHLAGEAEAFNTEARRNMTAAERREIPPWETEDRPRSMQTTGAYAVSADGRRYDNFGMQERLIANGAIPTSGVEEIENLVRAGMERNKAHDLVTQQRVADSNMESKNVQEYDRFINGTDEERAAMMEEAAAIKAANQGRVSRAAAALGAAAAANANAANAGQEPGVLEQLYDNSYAGQQAQALGGTLIDAGIQQMVDASNGIDFNPVVNDFSGALFDVTQSRNELNPLAREIFMNGSAVATEPTAGDRVADALQWTGLLDDNRTAAENTGDTLSTLGQMAFESWGPGYLATAPGYIAEAQQNIAKDGGSFEDYLTLGLEAVTGGIGRSTVRGAFRKAYPGIYQNPDELLSQVRVEPESGVLEQVFGVTRQDLADIGRTRQGNQPPALPGAAANPRGTPQGEIVMQPANTRRLVNSLENAMGSELEKGMSGWYVMDPMYDAYKALGLSDEEAAKMFTDFQTFTGIHSSASDVMTELTRGTGALYLHNQGRLDDYVNYGGKVGQPGAPEDMNRFPGHFAHKTAHGVPLLDYANTGVLTMKSPKVPLYIQSAMVPQTGFQTSMPVGDAHFSRAIGLADTRPDKGKGATNESWTTPEAQQLTPWWRDEVAGQVDLESVPAQALAWGLFSPQTGVDTPVGVPKLEILAQMIVKRAKERGISIEQARDEVLMGQDYVSTLSPK